MLDRLADIYAKYLTDEDVQASLRFYESPAGQHFNAVASDIMADTLKAGQDVVEAHTPDILKSLCKEFPELHGKAAFCQEKETPRSSELTEPAGATITSLGKGVAAASIGCLLESRGLRVILQNCDPYLNVDRGTMSPYQHGEV
jgi:hypothetical protein